MFFVELYYHRLYTEYPIYTTGYFWNGEDNYEISRQTRPGLFGGYSPKINPNIRIGSLVLDHDRENATSWYYPAYCGAFDLNGGNAGLFNKEDFGVEIDYHTLGSLLVSAVLNHLILEA